MATKKTTAGTAEKRTTAKAAAAAADKTTKAAVKGAPAKKAPAKRTAVKTALYVQFAGKEFTEKELVDAAKKAYVALGNQASDIKTMDVYVKPEESAAYYTVNGEGSDEFKIEL